MAKIYSNKAFRRQCAVRKGGGPTYNRFCPPKSKSNDNVIIKNPEKSSCSGPYDNLISYVFEIDLSNGSHLAYVDCDYVE